MTVTIRRDGCTYHFEGSVKVVGSDKSDSVKITSSAGDEMQMDIKDGMVMEFAPDKNTKKA